MEGDGVLTSGKGGGAQDFIEASRAFVGAVGEGVLLRDPWRNVGKVQRVRVWGGGWACYGRACGVRRPREGGVDLLEVM